ncbi:MAG TPA: hypothetical protein VFL76_08445 [Edaphocola sp.]|nr:hypothetical protein [Edaphocola sp.]
MQFKEVINHPGVKKHLISLFHSGRMPHALLFLGKEGVGGLPMAIAFAQYIFCDNKSEDDSCGQCSSCLKIAKLMHPDLHFTFPTIGAKPNLSRNYLPQFRDFVRQSPYAGSFDWLQSIQAENKQGNISADECRDIIDRLNLTAFESGYKIQVIWRPEYLGKEGNILLKLIEEPPDNTLIFLVAENEEDILNTILSRTQKIMLPPLSAKDIATALRQRLSVEERRAMQIAQVSDNSYAKALFIYHNSGQNDWMPVLRDWFNAIFTFSPLLTNAWVDDMAKNGREQQKHFLIFAQQMLNHVLRLTLVPGSKLPLIEEELDFARKLAKRQLPFPVFEHMQEAIQKAVYHIERNAHAKTQLLFLSLQMQYLIKGEKLETV